MQIELWINTRTRPDIVRPRKTLPCLGGCGRTRTGSGRFVCDTCKPARRAQTIRRYQEKRPKGRARSLWDIHRLTPSQFDAMVAAQGGRCAGCGRGDRELHIDHAHGCVHHRPKYTCGSCRRGLLCADCNHTLGMAGDNPATLRALAEYLERPR